MPLARLPRFFQAELCWVVFLTASAFPQNPVPFVNRPLVPTGAAPGTPGLTLTVNGTGFISGAAVKWNGNPRSTTFVSSSQLTAAIPASDLTSAGTAAVIVSNPGGAISQPMIFEVTDSVSSVGFARSDLGTSETCSPDFVLTADFNGDDKLDLLQCNGNQITVLLGDGDSTFTPLAPITLQGGGTFLAGDVNNDGKIDLVEVNNLLTVLLGNGDGTFQAPIVSQTPSNQAGQPALGDFNGDGRLDLALPIPCIGICDKAGYVFIYLGNGNGTFQNAISYNFSNFGMPGNIVLGDFNGDNKLDMALGTSPGNGTYLMLGNGDGSFQSPEEIASASAIVTADLNGDDKLDLVALPGCCSDDVSVYLGNGDGTFGPATNFATAGPISVIPYDVNGDGKVDLLVSGFSLSILLGNGDGTFQASSNFPISTSFAGPFAVGNFNEDGRLDLVMVAGPSDSVFLQTTVLLPTSPLAFGNQDVNTTSNPQTVTLTNLAPITPQINSIQIVGADRDDFTIQSNTCGSSVAAGQSCALNVTFTPGAKGARSATLQFTILHRLVRKQSVFPAPASAPTLPVSRCLPPILPFLAKRLG